MINPAVTEEKEIAYPKLNLALHVRKRLSNGYHQLETVFGFVDQGDEISVKAGANLSLTISGPFADDLDTQENFVLKAAQALRTKYDITEGAALHLQKNLPVASGIGGGSADAAATLRLLNRFWKLDVPQAELIEISKPLGADVPACLTSQTSVGSGIGQDLEPLHSNDLSGSYVLLVNPLVSIATQEIFQKWDGIDKGPLEFNNVSEALIKGRNDLQPAALNLEKSISPLLVALAETSPIAAKMSGSGATCFAVYDSIGKVAAADLKIHAAFKSIWTMTGRLR